LLDDPLHTTQLQQLTECVVDAFSALVPPEEVPYLRPVLPRI
jgi:hypothetical protein